MVDASRACCGSSTPYNPWVVDEFDTDRDASAPALVTEALDLMAHELRNATATLWTGTGLMADADAAELVEIAGDMRAPAELMLLMVDLVVEAARSTRHGATPEVVGLACVIERGAKRAQRGGLGIDVSPASNSDDSRVLAVVGSAERCLCAAAVATGGARVTIRPSRPDGIELVPMDDGLRLHERVVEAGALLGRVLAAGSGATWAMENSEPTRRVRLAFVPAPS